MSLPVAAVLFLVASVMPAASPFPDPAVDAAPARGKQTAVFAGGCFWCTEAVFEIVNGVSDVVSGYAGGTKDTARYETVSTGRTGHAEAILITYEPAVVSYGQLLKIFFSVAHDPTSLNRQGADVGPQYRSAIFYATEEQRRVAQAYIDQLNAAHVFPNPIVTELAPLTKFYTAEAHHQDFAARNPAYPYIVHVSDPKVLKLKQLYPGCVRRRK